MTLKKKKKRGGNDILIWHIEEQKSILSLNYVYKLYFILSNVGNLMFKIKGNPLQVFK